MDVQSIIDMLFTSTGPTTAAVSIPAFFELGATVTGAVSGALDGCNKRLDMLGVCVLALITALGGGLLRDIILPTDYVYMLENPIAVVLALVTGLAAFFFAGLFYKLDKPIAVFDIISVALFTCMGADKALMAGYGFITSVMMGAITGVGGGFIRDICIGRIPNIFKPSNFYAICSVVGGIVYYILVECHMVKSAAAVVCVVIVVGLRWLSLRYNLITATAVDLTPKITGPISRMRMRYHHAEAEGRSHSANTVMKENAASGGATSELSAETGEVQPSGVANWSETGDLYDAEKRKARELDEQTDRTRKR